LQEVTLEKTELEITRYAIAFREAITKAGKGVLITLDNFPAGPCGNASILLATYLQGFDMGGSITFVDQEMAILIHGSKKTDRSWISLLIVS
jgi:hypothetical protein